MLLATFAVNATQDALYPPPGYTTLRSAVVEANARFGDDTIILPAGNYRLTIEGRGENAGTTGDLDVTDNLTIRGAGAGTTIIDASGIDRLFHLSAGVSLDLWDLTLTGGNAHGTAWSAPEDYMGGGAIFSEGHLELTNCSVSDNSQTGGQSGGPRGGGAIYINNPSSTLTIRQSTFSGNAPEAIYAVAARSLTISDSTFSGNSAWAVKMHEGKAEITGSTFTGNGIAFWGSELAISDSTIRDSSGGGGLDLGGTATVDECIISGNSSSSGGGGIRNAGTLNVANSVASGNSATRGNFGPTSGGGILNNGVLTIENTTLSGNSTGEYGGGVANMSGTVTIRHSTVSDNSAARGGGVYGSATLNHTIIADNSATEHPDVYAVFNSQGYNLIGNVGSATGFDGPGDTVGTADSPIVPMLGPLQDNGGPTETHALLASSPAVNAGAPNFTGPPNFDQRGSGYPRVYGGRVDIGAFECQQAANSRPLADPGGPYSGDEGDDVPLNASKSSDPDGRIVRYEWDLDGDGQYDDATGVIAMFHATDDGQFDVAVKVTDDDGAPTMAATTVTVNNVPPSLDDLSITSPIVVNDVATLSGDILDPGPLDTFTLTVDWGDGAPTETFNYPAGATSFRETHQYRAVGTHLITLALSDDDLGEDGATLDITVIEQGENQAPVAVADTYSVRENDTLEVGAHGWATQPDIQAMPSARSILGVGVVDGILYAVGGSPPTGNATTVVEAYDPVTDSWSQEVEATVPRGGWPWRPSTASFT